MGIGGNGDGWPAAGSGGRRVGCGLCGRPACGGVGCCGQGSVGGWRGVLWLAGMGVAEPNCRLFFVQKLESGRQIACGIQLFVVFLRRVGFGIGRSRVESNYLSFSCGELDLASVGHVWNPTICHFFAKSWRRGR